MSSTDNAISLARDLVIASARAWAHRYTSNEQKILDKTLRVSVQLLELLEHNNLDTFTDDQLLRIARGMYEGQEIPGCVWDPDTEILRLVDRQEFIAYLDENGWAEVSE